jgi:ribonuclease R
MKKKTENDKKTYTGELFTTARGVGYVTVPEISSDEDIEIQPTRLNRGLNGDIVEIAVLKDQRVFDPRARAMVNSPRRQGEIVRIVERAKTEFVGTIAYRGGSVVLVPDDKKFYTVIVLQKMQPAPQEGMKALVAMTHWDEGKEPQGRLVSIIGRKGEHDAEMRSIVLDKGFATDYPGAVVAEANHIEKTEKPIPAAEIAKRRDFRKTLTVTIDPADAKDFDDAISFKKLPNGLYEIGVHIADVSHYVRERSALDKEAARRGTSVYLVDRTIPMLPEVLSNDMCSLNPNEDRLTFSAVFVMDDKGHVHERWFGRTVIHSHKRFTYEEAQECIVNKAGPYAEELIILNTIAKQLAKEKFAAGALDFEKDEVRFELDANGKPIRVYRKQRFDAHKLVEDFMLLANREVAEFMYRSAEKRRHESKKDGNSPSPELHLYRIHDLPDQDKLSDLAVFIRALGFEIESHDGKITSKSLRKLLDAVNGTPQESLIKTATIRSMAKAVYSTKNIGHFGLAFKYYTHFTSPIRRYPDLLVHRALAHYLANEVITTQEVATYERMAAYSTEREILAAEAERASIKYKQVEYMSERIGKEFTGTITGVTEWGIYVEENETKCEGMIKLRDLTDDYYILDQKNYCLVGEKSKKRFVLGDAIRFKVVSADMERRVLDYAIVK